MSKSREETKFALCASDQETEAGRGEGKACQPSVASFHVERSRRAYNCLYSNAFYVLLVRLEVAVSDDP
jgi:hypothetical protein